MQSDTATGKKETAVGEETETAQTHKATQKMEDQPNDVKPAAVTSEKPAAAKTTTPSRKRYTRAQLMHFRDTIDLTAPPVGYNPALLKPVEPLNKDIPQAARDSAKWNRSRSMGQWAGQSPGAKGGGMPLFSRLVEGTDEAVNCPTRGRALRSASWNEQQSGPASAPDKTFGRRNSRSDAPGRWDNNKDDQLSRSMEKRGPERWMSYGHRDSKDKPRLSKEEECIENAPEEQYHGGEPEWMHHRPSTDNVERIKQQRQFAQNFEEERKLMREKVAKETKERGAERGESSLFMTDEEINDYKKQLEAEERGMASAAFTFDSLKEAMKSQGVSNLPPMPTSGINTVDQIEKSLKASASSQMPRTQMSDLERQNAELLRAVSGQQANVANQAAAAANLEGASRLLSMLRGQGRPLPSFGGPNPAPQLQQPMGGLQMNVSPQQGLLQGAANTQLERLFAANPRVGANFGLPVYGSQQPQVPPPAMGNVPNIPFMQQAGQFNPRGGQQNPLLSALLANQAQAQAQAQAQNAARQKQAQMLAHLQQAQQQTALQNARAEAEAAGKQETVEDDGEGKGNTEPPPVQSSLLGLVPDASGSLQSQLPPPHFAMPQNFMGVRPSMPTAPGVFSPSMVNVPAGNPATNLFPGLPQGVNPTGLGGHPGFFMQNGGLARPVAPGLAGLNLAGGRPAMGGLGSVVDERQVPVLSGQPNSLQASLLAAQQAGGGGLNRFFGEHNLGAAGAFAADQPVVAPVRNRSLEELKNEAQ